MTSPLVIFTDISDLNPEPAEEYLRGHGYSTARLDLTKNHIIPECLRDAVALLVGFANISADIIKQLPRLKVLATGSVGTDMIDVEYANSQGIAVRNLAGIATEEVAVHALALLLASERYLVEAIETTQFGGWTTDFASMPRRLSNLTLGLIGLGRIGRHFADIASPLVSRTIAYDPYVERSDGIELFDSITEVLTNSQIVSLHLPLNQETRGIIGAKQLAALPDNSLLINVSRAELVDSDALLSSLHTKNGVRYAADVLLGEPPHKKDRLRDTPRSIVTPHIGFLSETSARSYETQPAKNIVEFLENLSPD